MPPSIDVASDQSSDVLRIVDEIPRGKRILRRLLHLNHFFVACLLAIIVLLIECYTKSPYWVLYLVPFIVVILIVETLYLLRRAPPMSLQESHLAPRRLIRRSFIYQTSAIFTGVWTLSCDWNSTSLEPLMVLLIWLVWMDGFMLFLLALTAREYKFLDWVEEPPPESEEPIRLHGEPEPERQSHQTDLDASDTTAMIKRLVQFFIHTVHLEVAIVLLAFIWHHILSSTASPAGLYLLPFIFVLIIVEMYHLLHRKPPKELVASFFVPPGLVNRAFVYQLVGAYSIVCSGYITHPNAYGNRDAFIPAFVVWIAGVVLLALGIASEEYGFKDWVEDPPLREEGQEGRGNLGLDDEEPVNGRVRLPEELV